VQSSVITFLFILTPTHLQDQLVTSTASKDLEVEISRLQTENADLKRKVADFGVVESAKKRAEDKIEVLEKKVRISSAIRCNQRSVDNGNG
jgi:hypothetical protein